LVDISASAHRCNNFYEFSCGRWIAEAEIPATQTAFAKAWDAADDQATEALHKLLAVFALCGLWRGGKLAGEVPGWYSESLPS